jgi:hypothetical protein
MLRKKFKTFVGPMQLNLGVLPKCSPEQTMEIQQCKDLHKNIFGIKSEIKPVILGPDYITHTQKRHTTSQGSHIKQTQYNCLSPSTVLTLFQSQKYS